MHLMGILLGTRPNNVELRLRVAHRSGNPKKIVQAIVGSISSSPMHSKSIGLEGEERFGSCKKKLNTMIGSLQDSHQLNKVKFQCHNN
jgi:hypothetical protein